MCILYIFLKIFFKSNIINLNINNSWDANISIKNIIKTTNPLFFLKLCFIFIIFYLIFILNLHLTANTYWWLYFKINSFTIYIYAYILTIGVFYTYITKKHINTINYYNLDYFYAYINIIVILPLVFISNNFIIFFFLLELASLFIFYQFINSRFHFFNKYSINNFFSIYSKNYINIIFFNYWATFISSIFILYSLFLIIAYFNTTEFFLLNFLYNININLNYIPNNLLFIFSFLLFIIAFILKLGFVPLQLYKIEIYKSLPYLTIFFYTVWYFLIFFIFFILLYVYYLSSVGGYTWFILIIICIVGFIYILYLIFNINLVKSFLAYSTIVNSLLFVLFLISTIS